MNEEVDHISNLDKKKLLEEFVFNNHTLEELESIVDQFNIFSSLGVIKQEVKHSNFLGWLLNPKETHNLNEYFTAAFLKMVAFKDKEVESEIDLLAVDALDLTEATVLLEWNKIDLLIVDDVNKVLCVIENKVDSTEHSNQLTRYREVVESNYPSYRKLYVYLTINGENSKSNPEYTPVGYNEISELITRLLEAKKSQLNDEVTMFISHYNEMIKRYIMEDSDVQALCEQLYKKHKSALDLIFKYKPDIYMDIKDILVEILEEQKDWINLDHCSKSYIRFIPDEIDFIPKEGQGWVKSNRILLFEILNYDKSVDVALLIGPGKSSIREDIYNHVKDDKLFSKTYSSLPKQWATTYKFHLAKIASLEDKSKEEIKEVLKNKLDKLFHGDYVEIKKSLLQLKQLKFS